jgi:hypothetical protein
MNRYLLVAFIFIAFLSSYQNSYSQFLSNVRVSASNTFRYGNGNEVSLGTSQSHKEYFEELGDVRLFVNDFLVGFRYEFDDPIEFGTSFKGFSRRFVEYNKDNFNVRVGNFYELFGKGLILNSFESRGLGFNTQLDGIKLYYKKTINNVKLDGTILGGDLNYNDYLVPGRVENYAVRAGSFNVSPFKPVSLGGSYLFTKGVVPSGTINSNMSSEIFEGNFSFDYKTINLLGSYAKKHTLVQPGQLFPNYDDPKGDGGYASLSFTKPSLGITIDYKNYRYNLTTPDQRSTTNPEKALPFQVPPSCIKEYSWTLLSRYPHAVDFNDELGYQFDAFYSPKENLTFNLNASLTSRHYDYKNVDTTNLTRYQRISRSFDFLPSPKDQFSPYWEFYIEGEYYYKKNTKIRLALGRQSAVIYSNVDPSTSQKETTTNIPLEVTHEFLKKYSVKLIAETQWVYNSLRATSQKQFFNEYLSLSFSRSPDIILNGSLELSNDKEDPSRNNPLGHIVFWGIGEITYKFSSANSLTFSYGSERGGLKCTSGICRYVNPFSGFRLMVINNFN